MAELVKVNVDFLDKNTRWWKKKAGSVWLPPHAHVLFACLMISAYQSNTTEEAFLWLMKNQRCDKWRIRWNWLPFMRRYHVSWQTFAVAVRACKSSKPSTAKEKKKAKESGWKALQFLLQIRSFNILINSIVLSVVWICRVNANMQVPYYQFLFTTQIVPRC